MVISKILSYKNAWDQLIQNNQSELDDILLTIPCFIQRFLKIQKQKRRILLRDIWSQELVKQGWNIPEEITFHSDSRQRINFRTIGPLKNNISATLDIGYPHFLNRWLFQQATMACKYDIIKIPVMIVPATDFNIKMGAITFGTNKDKSTFEFCKSQLEPLTPMSHKYPFLILGFAPEHDLFNSQVFELESDPLVLEAKIIVDRCIEFPPEYYHAGVNILSFFSTYISEQYPNEKAKVRIEQKDNVVRLIIETEDGKTEIIEKALEEYQLIVSGKITPESVTNSDKLVLELKNELRIAKYRVESQHDIIQLQDSRIDKLMEIVGNGLVAKQTLSVDFHPNISTTTNVSINQNISLAIGNLTELKDIIPKEDVAHLTIIDLEGSLEAIEKEQNPEVVKKSSAMSKFKRFIDNISDDKSNLSKTIKAAETGWDIIKDLAGKYNSIAQWCGLPQVPTIFT